MSGNLLGPASAPLLRCPRPEFPLPCFSPELPSLWGWRSHCGMLLGAWRRADGSARNLLLAGCEPGLWLLLDYSLLSHIKLRAFDVAERQTGPSGTASFPPSHCSLGGSQHHKNEDFTKSACWTDYLQAWPVTLPNWSKKRLAWEFQSSSLWLKRRAQISLVRLPN